MQIFSERLGNELTRDATLKALTMIALNNNDEKDKSDTPLIPLQNLSSFLKAFFELLKKSQRQLHLNTLECLEAFTRRYPGQFAESVKSIQTEIAPMIEEHDLQRSALALSVASNLIITNPKTPGAHSAVITYAAKASSSELVQGVMLQKL